MTQTLILFWPYGVLLYIIRGEELRHAVCDVLRQFGALVFLGHIAEVLEQAHALIEVILVVLPELGLHVSIVSHFVAVVVDQSTEVFIAFFGGTAEVIHLRELIGADVGRELFVWEKLLILVHYDDG